MKINEIKDGTRKVDLTAKLVAKEEAREVNTRNGRTKVCNATLEDETGTIVLVLWGDEVDQVKEGDTVKIENGFAKEWNGTLQVSAGRYGKLVVE